MKIEKMSKRETTQRQLLIVTHLRKSPATFEEIDKMLKKESAFYKADLNVSKRTFQRDISDIRELFGVDISFDPYIGAYCVSVDDQDEKTELILESFHKINALKQASSLTNFIQFENRKPKGTEFLLEIIHSIANRQIMRFTYERYSTDGQFCREVEPLALKEFKSRWYIIGRDQKNGNIRTYGLDRIEELEITKKKFIYPGDFNYSRHFKHSFGIIIPENSEPQDIILKFDGQSAKYIKSMPLHESQNIISDTGNELTISLNLYITFDLVVEILSYGEHVKVIQPQSLIDQVLKSLKNTISRYDDTN